jgi:hypothetical protein
VGEPEIEVGAATAGGGAAAASGVVARVQARFQEGEGVAELRRAGARWSLSHRELKLEPGEYQLWAAFAEGEGLRQVGSLVLMGGEARTIRCRVAQRRCLW